MELSYFCSVQISLARKYNTFGMIQK